VINGTELLNPIREDLEKLSKIKIVLNNSFEKFKRVIRLAILSYILELKP